MNAMLVGCIRELVSGIELVCPSTRHSRSRECHDKVFEVRAIQNLAAAAVRRAMPRNP